MWFVVLVLIVYVVSIALVLALGLAVSGGDEGLSEVLGSRVKQLYGPAGVVDAFLVGLVLMAVFAAFRIHRGVVE